MALRVSAEGLARLDELAALAGVQRSEMVRRLLAAALADGRIVARVTKRPQ